MKNLLIMLAACLPLMLLPGCSTARAVDEIKSETAAEIAARADAVTTNIAIAIEAWWAEKEASGEGATLADLGRATKRITGDEWESAKTDIDSIGREGVRRAKEASKGWLSELGSNAPGAMGRLAMGDWVGGIMTLLGVGAGAVGVARKYTAKVVTENDDKREEKYKPGGTHEALAELLKNADLLVALAAEAKRKKESGGA